MVAWMLTAVLLVGASPPADTVVVCPTAWRGALEEWLEYRRGQGHVVELLEAGADAADIRRAIGEAARGGRLRYVVLVGDVTCAGEGKSAPDNNSPGALNSPDDGAGRRPGVPTYLVEAKVNVHWGSEPLLATDHPYGDLDDDGQPELAVGRLPADSAAELAELVRRTLDYERSRDFGPWRQRVNLVAGVGDFGPLADAALEAAARYFITQGIPPEVQTSMTYASWRSPYCPDPRRFHQTAVERWNEGSWFWVYIGHAQPWALDRPRLFGASRPILAAGDVGELRCRAGCPIALFLCCYVGAFDLPEDCLAEKMLLAPGGPVAVLAGSRVTMPYAMTVLANGLLDECFRRRVATLGDAVLGAKRRLIEEPAEDETPRRMLDSVARLLSPMPRQLAAERAEHVLLFNLLGDPLLRLRHPKPVEVRAAARAAPGERLDVAIVSPVPGRATAELILSRGRLREVAPRRAAMPRSADECATFQPVYRSANDTRLVSVDCALVAGRGSVTLEVPRDIEGPCHVAVFVEGDDDFASGAADVLVQRSGATEPSPQPSAAGGPAAAITTESPAGTSR